uniref:Csu474(RpS14) n=1 Tax=Arundo donax TaxID=35708 RepID=A0A0A9GQ20_ARUDO
MQASGWRPKRESGVPAIILSGRNYETKQKVTAIFHKFVPYLVSNALHDHFQASSWSFLIVSICFAGFSPLGQACVQFLMVWQR